MATPFTAIYDLALVSIKDFRLDKLYQTSPPDFYNMLNGFLVKSIPKFTTCRKNLADRTTDSQTGQFNETLSDIEMDILSCFFVVEWLTSQINDARQISLLANDTDFKHTSEANVLNAKTLLKDKTQEQLSDYLVQYGILNTDWDAWGKGIFS